MPIKNWSTTPASNNSAAPFGFPENMAPSGVNDAARQVMADVRSQCEDAEWFNWGDTPSRASATTFKIGADVTTRYLVNRAIKCNDGSTLYGIVTASSYSAPDTTVTVNLDSGSLTTSLSSVALAILSPTNRAIPTALGRKGADVASASTINLSTAAGDFVDITGTTTITAITSEVAGIIRRTRTTGALQFTHNATSLILPGGANITSAANDRQEWVSLGSGNWLCFSYYPAAGLGAPFIDSTALVRGSADATKLLRFEVDGLTTATTRVFTAPDCDLPGHYVQHAYVTTATVTNISTAIPYDDTIPQNTEGVEILSVSITPKNTNNILSIEATAWGECGSGSLVTIALFQDSTANALAASGIGGVASNASLISGRLRHEMTAGTTSATTFKIRVGPSTGNFYVNATASATRLYGGVGRCTLTVTEYSA
jgi:hypothetical protein